MKSKQKESAEYCIEELRSLSVALDSEKQDAKDIYEKYLLFVRRNKNIIIDYLGVPEELILTSVETEKHFEQNKLIRLRSSLSRDISTYKIAVIAHYESKHK